MALAKKKPVETSAIVALTAAEAPAVAAAVEKPAPSKTPAPKFLVKLTGCQQIQDPGTKVTLFQNQMIPVPEISNWVKFQASVGYLEIIEL